MSLIGTVITDKDDIFLLSDNVTGKAIINGSFIDRRLKGEVKIFYTLRNLKNKKYHPLFPRRDDFISSRVKFLYVEFILSRTLRNT